MIYRLLVVSLVSILSFSGSSAQDIQKVTLPGTLPLVIIGSGPAGLTAAQYGVHLGIPTTLFSGPIPGGLLVQTSAIENYPGVKSTPGEMFMETMIAQTRERGATIREETVVSVDLSRYPYTLALDNGEIYQALSIIIATGAAPKKLGVPGEEKYFGKGVSSCAICDGHFFNGKDVVVVGGGDSAIEEAILLSPHVKSVTILVRGHRMRAASHMQNKLQGYPNINPIEYMTQVAAVKGTADEVTHLEVLNLVTNKRSKLKTDGLFLAIGHIPATDLFEGQLKCADSGHILIDEQTQATSVPGVFAAGDVEDAVYRQAIVAAGRGCKAAIKAVEWLRENGLTDVFLKKLTP